MTDEPNPAAAAHLTALLNGFWPVQAIGAAATLRLPDLLAEGPRLAADLAAAAAAQPHHVERLLRALSTLDLCRQNADDRFELTSAGQLLRADVPGSVRGMAMHMAGPIWRSWADLAEVVRTGKPSPAVVSGAEGFDAFAKDPDAAAVFNQSMVDGSRRVAEAAVARFDFGRFKTVMDVGGGYGAVLAVLLRANPHQHGLVYDLPYLEARTTQFLAAEGVGDRAGFVGGSFFEGVPARADCYLLKYIVHDWGDAHALTLLKHCRAAAGNAGTVLLIEKIVPERMGTSATDRFIARGDLTMMVYGGVERTEAEFRTLLAEAGLAIRRIVPLPEGFSILETQAGL